MVLGILIQSNTCFLNLRNFISLLHSFSDSEDFPILCIYSVALAMADSNYPIEHSADSQDNPKVDILMRLFRLHSKIVLFLQRSQINASEGIGQFQIGHQTKQPFLFAFGVCSARQMRANLLYASMLTTRDLEILCEISNLIAGV